MGVFTQRQTTYAPPFDGSKPAPTLVGGAADQTASPESEVQLSTELGTATLPSRATGDWKIQLRDFPITGHRSRAVLVLVGPDGKTSAELNGLSNSRNFGKNELGQNNYYDALPLGPDGSKLIARSFEGPTKLGENTVRTIDVASGSYDDIVQGAWARGIRTADQINRLNLDYKSHDPAYEFGGDGGEIQNSNSVAYTLSKAMRLDLDSRLRDAGIVRKFSGWGRNLLDPNYQRYVAPPTFPNAWTP